jgi:hypothetical protein
MGGVCGTYIGEKNCIQVSWGNLKKRDNLEDPGAGGRVILKSMFRKYGVRAGTGFIWLRSDGGPLYTLMNLRVP